MRGIICANSDKNAASATETPLPRVIKTPSNMGKVPADCTYIIYDIETPELIILTTIDAEFSQTQYAIDKSSGEIHRVELTNRDVASGERSVRFAGKTSLYSMPYDPIWLIELRDAGKLSGKPAEVAAGLTEEDNPVIMVQK